MHGIPYVAHSSIATKDSLVLLCTYNERQTLPTLLEAIERTVPGMAILIVDDDSPDGTGAWVASQLATRPHLRLLAREGKLGLGSAILAGIRYGLDHGYDYLMNLDADLSHDPHQIPQFFEAMQPSKPLSDRREPVRQVDLVIGSRYVPGGQMVNCSWKRHGVSRAANYYTRLFLGLKMRDCSSAFRLYRLSALGDFPWDLMECSGYGFLEEVLWWMTVRDHSVKEIPIVYTEREQGDSKISLREALGTMKIVHRLARRRWRMMIGRQA